jgi:hypothetical protein
LCDKVFGNRGGFAGPRAADDDLQFVDGACADLLGDETLFFPRTVNVEATDIEDKGLTTLRVDRVGLGNKNEALAQIIFPIGMFFEFNAGVLIAESCERAGDC